MKYTKQEKKTLWEGRQLVSGINCRPESVYDDFLHTKLLYHKESGTMFYHMVQSFPADEEIDPAAAHTAVRGESWKFQLMNTIDECMQYARSREEFITLMRSEGCDVRWTDKRKNVTYTTPGGMRCRDDRLHDEKYLKERMELEFRIRQAVIYGGAAPAEYTEITSGDTAPHSGRVGGAGRRIDSKTLRREREKKIALGHREDDHKDTQTWRQTM